jgi:hypothetical protein
LIVSSRRDADAARVRNALKTRRNVHSVAKNVMRLNDDVSDIDANAKLKPRIFAVSDRDLIDTALELHRSPNRLDRAWKLRQEAIAGIAYNAAPVFSDCRMDSLRQQHALFGVGSFFVIVHEPRIASHIGGQYRRQPALDPDWPFLHHWAPANPMDTLFYDGSDRGAMPQDDSEFECQLYRPLCHHFGEVMITGAAGAGDQTAPKHV